MKKQLLLSLATLACVSTSAFAADDFVAQELDGRLIQIENNENAGSCLNVTGNLVTTSPEKSNFASTAWLAEYDAEEDGVYLSHNGVYIGRMPVANGNFNGLHIAAVTSKAEAGCYRFYPLEDHYALTCTRDTNGDLIETIGQTGAFGDVTGWWIQDGGSGSGTAVNRWGSNPATSRWNYSFIDEVNVEEDFNIPTESGWYAVQLKTTDKAGKWYVNVDEEYQQSVTNCYALRFAEEGFFDSHVTPAKGLVYVEIVDGKNYIRTLNGHYASSKGFGLVADGVPNITLNGLTRHVAFTAGTDGNPKTCNIGAYWMDWTPTANNPEGYTYNGAGSGNTNLSFGFHKANPEVNYDVWTVTIEGETYQTPIKNNVRVTLDHPNNAGLATVFHNGTFMLSKGATIEESQISVTLNDANVGKVADIVIDNKTHMLSVTIAVPTALIRPNLERYKSDNRSAQTTLLTSTGLFQAEEIPGILDAHYETITISDDNLTEEGLEEAKSKVDNVPLAAVREKIDGQKVYLSCHSNDNNGSNDHIIGVQSGTVHHAAPADPVDIRAAWVIDFTNDNHVTLHNLAYDNYFSGVVAGNKDEAVAYEFAFDVANHGRFTFKNEAQSGNNYLNQHGRPNIGYWTANSSNNGSFWQIHLVDAEMEQTWYDEVTAEPSFDAWTMGEEPGLYVHVPAYVDYVALCSEVKAAGVENFDYVKARTILDSRTAATTPVLFDLNSIEGPALIQMAYTPNNGVTTYNETFSGRNQVSDSNNQNTLSFEEEASTFVLSNGMLHSLNNGRGVVYGDNGPMIYEGENWSENVDAMKLDFCEVNKSVLVTSPDGVARHTYAIKQFGSSKTFGATEATHRAPWGNEAGTPGANYAYTVWYVKTLAVNVEESGYKLWRTPVAVNFGDNEANGAYTVSVKGNTITTAPAEASTTYGAGSVFILTQDVILNVENGSNAPAYGTAGLGHHAKQAHQMTAGNVYLTIHADQSVAQQPAPAAVRGLLFDAPELPKVKMAVEIPAEDTTKVLDAHAAVIEAAPSEKSTLKDGGAMMLSLGGSNDTTEIAEIGVDNNAAAGVIYDLQGRRLAAPAKGINIVNGKKVLVK